MELLTEVTTGYQSLKEDLHQSSKNAIVRSQAALTLHYDRINNNLSVIKERLKPGTRIMVMLKALGYGTHAVTLAKHLESVGIDIFGVAHVEEGIALREAGVKADIFVIHVFDREIPLLIEWNLQTCISTFPFLKKLTHEAKEEGTKLKVHLNLNLGMSRFDCNLEEGFDLAKTIYHSPHTELEGVMTHLPNTSFAEKDETTRSQISSFEAFCKKLKEEEGILAPYYHCLTSEAIFTFDQAHTNMIRLGLSLFGWDTTNRIPTPIQKRLQSSLELTAPICQIFTCKRDQPISYGNSFVAEFEGQKIAIVKIGYADGLMRAFRKNSSVLIKGRPAPLVGTICMDFCFCDVTHIPDVEDEDTAWLIHLDHPGFRAHEVAKRLNISPREYVTILGERVKREFVE